PSHDDVDIAANELGSDVGNLLGRSLRPTISDGEILPLDVTVFPQGITLRLRSASSMSPNVNVLTVSAVATTGFSSDFSGSGWTENQNCFASASQCGQLKAS